MSALLKLNDRSDDRERRGYPSDGSHAGAWSVLPLHPRVTPDGGARMAFHGNAALDLLEEPVATRSKVLRLVGEWTSPGPGSIVEEERVKPAVDLAVDLEPDFHDGDLVALGTLACLVSAVLSTSVLVGLSTFVF
ncbi:MAG: hypothetical protein U1E66_02430 [Rhodospirillales bacterium]